jgi:MFS family permease
MAPLALSMLLASMGVSIANIALPTVGEAFTADFPQVQWVTIAYLLAVTTLVVVAGGLGDRLGHGRMLLAGITLFTVASAACGMAPSLPILIASRVLHGVGGAVLMAVTAALVRETVPTERTGRAMGLLGTMSAFGTALGPSLGGALIGGFGWRAVFWALVPMGLVTFALAWRRLPRGGSRSHTRAAPFDVAGTVVLGLTLAAYTLALTVGGEWSGALWVVAMAGLAVFVPLQLNRARPLIQLRMLRDPVLAGSLAINLLVATVMMATLVLGPVYLAHGLGLAAAVVGATMAVGPVVAMLSGIPAGRIVDSMGTGHVVVGGLAVMTLGTMGLALLPGTFGLAGYVAGIALLTPGYQMVQAANTTQVMAQAASDQRGVISGLLNLSRNLGLVTGASAMGVIFAFGSGGPDVTVAAPSDLGAALRLTFLVAVALIVVAAAVAVLARHRAAEVV